MWTIIKQMFVSVWHFVQGIFMFSLQWRKQKKLSQELDIKFYYKQKVKKKTIGMSVREKMMITKALKQLDKKDKFDYAVYNYIVTVVYRARPGMTMRDGIKEFYDLFHPFFKTYHNAYEDLRKLIVKHKGGKVQAHDWLELTRKYEGSRNIFTHAKQILQVHQEVIREVKQEEQKYMADKRKDEDTTDKKMLEVERDILDARIENDKKFRDQLSEAIKSENTTVSDKRKG